jgi:hypothetical protein
VTVAHQGAPKEWAGRQESNMKKLLGLSVLACMPVACGTVPTAPEITPTSASTEPSTFSASGRGRVVIEPSCPVEPDWASVRGLSLVVTRADKTSVTARVELLVIGDMGPTPCFTPTFSVEPVRRGVELVPGKDPQEITLTGPSGRYVLSARANGLGRQSLVGSVSVALPSDGR